MVRMLQRVTVEGLRSIRRLDSLELRPLNVLIGANGAGKSNFISVFTLLNQIVVSNLQVHVGQAGGAESLLHFGSRTTDEIVIDVQFGSRSSARRNGYRCVLVPTADERLIFSAEERWYHDTENHPDPFVVKLGHGHRETQLFAESDKSPFPRIADHVIQAMRGWKVYHFHDTSDASKVRKLGDIADNELLRPDGANLAAYLFFLRERHPEHYRQVVSTIRLVAPFFDDFVLRPYRLAPERIQLEWREVHSDGYFNANALSDGTLRFMCLAVLLLQPDLPSTLLIDEPELGLHPYAVALLASMLQSAATRSQVIVSTQSVTLVNQFGPEDVIVVDRRDSQSTFERFEPEGLDVWLDEYGMGDLWEKNLVGGRPTWSTS